MIREFSEEKKEELYAALYAIDIKDWKPFQVWCGSRVSEFGDWVDKLGIQTYMVKVDAYQNKILNMNSSTRNQIDIIFENVAEVDRRYAGIFREHAETVRGQIAQVQAMIQVMRAVNGEDKNEDGHGIYTDEDVSITMRWIDIYIIQRILWIIFLPMIKRLKLLSGC